MTTPVPAASEPDAVDVVSQAVISVPGVVGLHGGMFGEVATYLPGRRVSGIKLGPDASEVHVTLEFGTDVRAVAGAVRAAVAAVVPGPVHVVVEDVVAVE